ncbi:MAG: hypothetical protein MZW92_31505 [Comamonadaceae bacterium]|nr:hypothetical protein [Comamonadaceae bacterium]
MKALQQISEDTKSYDKSVRSGEPNQALLNRARDTYNILRDPNGQFHSYLSEVTAQREVTKIANSAMSGAQLAGVSRHKDVQSAWQKFLSTSKNEKGEDIIEKNPDTLLKVFGAVISAREEAAKTPFGGNLAGIRSTMANAIVGYRQARKTVPQSAEERMKLNARAEDQLMRAQQAVETAKVLVERGVITPDQAEAVGQRFTGFLQRNALKATLSRLFKLEIGCRHPYLSSSCKGR